MRKGILKGETEEKLIYYDGVESPAAEVTLRLNDMPPGEYYCLYMADFKDDDRFKRLNLSLYSKFLQKRGEDELKIIKEELKDKNRQSKFAKKLIEEMENPNIQSISVEFERIENDSFAGEDGKAFFD
jgi:hypothetical protein